MLFKTGYVHPRLIGRYGILVACYQLCGCSRENALGLQYTILYQLNTDSGRLAVMPLRFDTGPLGSLRILLRFLEIPLSDPTRVK